MKLDKIFDEPMNAMGARVDRGMAELKGHIMYIEDEFNKKCEIFNQKFEQLSFEAKIVIGISLGLSMVDTILLIAILKKLK